MCHGVCGHRFIYRRRFICLVYYCSSFTAQAVWRAMRSFSDLVRLPLYCGVFLSWVFTWFELLVAFYVLHIVSWSKLCCLQCLVFEGLLHNAHNTAVAPPAVKKKSMKQLVQDSFDLLFKRKLSSQSNNQTWGFAQPFYLCCANCKRSDALCELSLQLLSFIYSWSIKALTLICLPGPRAATLLERGTKSSLETAN